MGFSKTLEVEVKMIDILSVITLVSIKAQRIIFGFFFVKYRIPASFFALYLLRILKDRCMMNV